MVRLNFKKEVFVLLFLDRSKFFLLVACFLFLSLIFISSPVFAASDFINENEILNQNERENFPLQIILNVSATAAYIDGEEKDLQAAPYIKEDTTLVPLRFIGEAFGAEVRWDGTTKTITIITAQHNILLQIGNKTAVLDGQNLELKVAPEIKSSLTMVPLRFIAEGMGIDVGYYPEEKEIRIGHQGQPPKAQIYVEKRSIVLGESLVYKDASIAEEGYSIVTTKWENEPPWPAPGNYTIRLKVQDNRGLWSKPISTTINVVAPPNRAPVARFQVSKAVVDQGETIYYTDLSYDPDSDSITERQWQGKAEAFFSPGEKEVTLRVKDSRGNWSEPYALKITVTNKVLMDEFTYRLAHAKPGDIISGPHQNLLDLPAANLEHKGDDGPTLFYSNTPEDIYQPGILYKDTLNGDIRAYYWHANKGSNNLRLLLVAVNETKNNLTLKIKKSATAGPASGELYVGSSALARYFGPQNEVNYNLKPGEMVILNYYQYNVVKPGDIIHGIYELYSDGDVTLATMAVAPDANPRTAYASLSVLEPTGNQSRGTFENSNRHLEVTLPKAPARFNLIDSSEEFIEGQDNTSGLSAVNRGNYGVHHTLSVKTTEKTALLFNPRGGVFSGILTLDGTLLPVPNSGFVMNNTDVVVAAILPENEEFTLEFMPPGGSYLPLNVIFWPMK